MKPTRQTKTESDASIKFGTLYLGDDDAGKVGDEMFISNIDDGYTRAIRVISLSRTFIEHWYLEGVGFQQDEINMQFTIRSENRSGKLHWYAYRRVHGKLHKRYVGKTEDITEYRLAEVAKNLPG